MALERKFADIIVDISHEKLDKEFQYIIPDEILDDVYPGVRVEIPFGKGDRMIKGYVTQVTERPSYDVNKMKPIHNVIKGSIPIESQMISLAWWIKEHYGSTMNQALKTVIPIKTRIKPKTQKYIELTAGPDEILNLIKKYENSKKYISRLRLLQEIRKEKILPYEMITDKLNISASVVKSLEQLGVIKVTVINTLRDTVHTKFTEDDKIILNSEQQAVADDIMADMHTRLSSVHLIFGVTGSGKTEIYIRLIEEVIKEGRQAIVLIPEIALTYQTVLRFYKRFKDRVSFINSKLSHGERHDQFEKARNGEIDIMIGPRSAIFTPFKNLGIIIIDEEHEAAYKNDSIPKYHVREVAIERAKMTGSAVILGSATPSVDSYYKARQNEYKLHVIKNRVKDAKLPMVHLVDLREELKKGNHSIFSDKLNELIVDRLNHNRQIMLFINRRGYAGFVSCRSCGYAIKCKHCDVGLTAHNNGKLICHYCGYEIPIPKTCPKCGSKYIAAFGIGTQKIEAYVKSAYPAARVLRMDMDTTAKKDSHEKILSQFANHEADILIGTQMIVKGHDFPLVTLVGVVAADLSLYAGDFHSSERTFQLITQAAGRAGRGLENGEVVIQTYSPDNYSILSAAAQDYEGFYEQEILYRKLMQYPPLIHMAAILMTSADEGILNQAAELILNVITKNQDENLKIIGPADAGISRISDIYRKVIYLKHSKYIILMRLREEIEDLMRDTEYLKVVGIQFDFAPMSNY